MRQSSILIAIVALSVPGLNAQESGILKTLPADELTVVEAIALYPPVERTAVLTLAVHPEILVRMEHLRIGTEDEFRKLIDGIPEEEQLQLYNLTRYPDLIKTLGEREKKYSNAEMKEILVAYPEEIHQDALDANRNHFDQLKAIHALNLRAINDFETIIAMYADDVKDAARRIANLPAVATVLTDNMQLTVLLGDIYWTNPSGLTHELDSLSILVSAKREQELEEWKQQLENNPEAKAEYEQAALDYAGGQQYDDDVYSGPIPDRYREEAYVDYIWQPYSYWFGWPYGYPYGYWYPYPWWYHWGFYYGPGQAMIIIGFPSTYFYGWYWGYDPHLYHYPHYTDEVIRHYYGPRTTGSNVQPVLRTWEANHRDELPKNWWNDDKNRVDRIREYGRFKMDYAEIVDLNRDNAPTPREYLEKNANQYPTLKPVLKEKPAPPVYRVPAQPRPQSPSTPPRDQQQVYPTSDKPVTPDKAPRQETIDRAREQHESTWEPMRTPPKQSAPPPRTAPSRTAPPKSTPPKTAPPRSQPRKNK